jgi:hypothetical protein
VCTENLIGIELVRESSTPVATMALIVRALNLFAARVPRI